LYFLEKTKERETLTYDEKCDMWSLGILIHFLITGYYPFEGENNKETLRIVLRDTFST